MNEAEELIDSLRTALKDDVPGSYEVISRENMWDHLCSLARDALAKARDDERSEAYQEGFLDGREPADPPPDLSTP